MLFSKFNIGNRGSITQIPGEASTIIQTVHQIHSRKIMVPYQDGFLVMEINRVTAYAFMLEESHIIANHLDHTIKKL